MRKAQLLVLALVLFLLLVACAPAALPAPAPEEPTPAAATPVYAPAPAAAAPLKAVWEAEWERTVEAARKEGAISLLTAIAESRRDLTQPLLQKYGIKLETLVGRGPDLVAKILVERRARIYSYDVYRDGDTSVLTSLKPAGVFDSLEPALILPEVTDPKGWYNNTFPWLDRDHTAVSMALYEQVVLAVNTNLVKPPDGESYKDFLQPKYKGKILIFDPLTGGGSKTARMLGEKIMGWDYLYELAKQEPVILKDARQAIDWLAFGKGAVLFGPKSDTLVEVMKAGAPVKILTPKEGSYLTGGSETVGLINKAPHPNAAKVFINWLLSKEGQLLAHKSSGRHSARVDISTQFVDPNMLRKPGIKYFNALTEEFLLGEPEGQKKNEEIFGHLLK